LFSVQPGFSIALNDFSGNSLRKSTHECVFM
jgi:hypothetical protein